MRRSENPEILHDVPKNKLSTVRLLLRMGADPTLFGRWGRAEGTPIQFARSVEMASLIQGDQSEF